MMQEADVVTYTSRFNDLSNLCPRMVTHEDKKIEKYIGGLSLPIQGLVSASKPTTFDSTNILAFSMTNQEDHCGTIVQKADLPKVEGRKSMFVKDSKGKDRKPI